MAFFDTTWYVNSVGYAAVTVRPQNAAVAAGVIRRQFTAPAVGSERVFICGQAGTTANTTDATWNLSHGTKTTDGTAAWFECSGTAALNGDAINTPTWATAKATGNPTLGAIIKRNNGASYQICSAGAGALGASEPAFSDTAGVTTVDSGTTWTCLGPVGNFTAGGAPHARLANALASGWFASGNTVYVGNNHAETQSAAISISATSALLAKIICFNSAGSYPPTAPATGATITSTAGGLAATLIGSIYFYGLTFVVGAGGYSFGASAVTQVQNWYYFDNCSFQITTAGIGNILFGNGAAATWHNVVLDNSTVKFGAVGQYMNLLLTQFTWRNTGPILVSGSSVPTTLFLTQSGGGQVNSIVLEGLDLSQLTGSLYANTAAPSVGSFIVKDCKLNATATVTQPINTGQVVQLSRSDSAATAYKSSRTTYEGVESTETSIVRTGGYADSTGQAQSRKVIISANAQWLRPYKSQPLSVWNSTVGSPITVTVYGTVNAGALPNNDDIWMELSYLGSGASPLGSIVTTGKDNNWSANAAGSSDSSVWGTPHTTLDGTPSAAVTMSNGNLTATRSGIIRGGVASTAFISAGKYYFEVTNAALTTSADAVGLLRAGGLVTDNPGITATHVVVSTGTTNSLIIANGVDSGKNLGAYAVGDVFAVAVDLSARLIWIRKNGGNWNADAVANPATGTGGVSFTAGSYAPLVVLAANGTLSGSWTANFGQSIYSGTPPSGFLSWDTAWVPFKLSTTITPQLPGYVIPVIKAAKASTTYYIDPAVVVI